MFSILEQFAIKKCAFTQLPYVEEDLPKSVCYKVVLIDTNNFSTQYYNYLYARKKIYYG